MPGQAAKKSRSEVCAAMNKADCTPMKKHATGGEPTVHNNITNKSIGMNGSITGKTKQIKIEGYC